jgi:hypothetical protein
MKEKISEKKNMPRLTFDKFLRSSYPFRSQYASGVYIYSYDIPTLDLVLEALEIAVYEPNIIEIFVQTPQSKLIFHPIEDDTWEVISYDPQEIIEVTFILHSSQVIPTIMSLPNLNDSQITVFSQDGTRYDLWNRGLF